MATSIALPIKPTFLENRPQVRMFIKTSAEWIEASCEENYWTALRQLDWEFFWNVSAEERIEGFWPYMLFPEEWPPGILEDYLEGRFKPAAIA